MEYKHPGLQTNSYRQNLKYKNMIRDRDNHTCQLCGAPGDTVDHIVPFAVSHDSSPTNLRVLCRSCNLATRRKPKNASPFDTMIELAKCSNGS